MRNYEFHKCYKFRFVTAVRRGAISEKVFSDTYTIKLAPHGIRTHNVRAVEIITTLRILINLPSTLTLVTSLLEVAAE